MMKLKYLFDNRDLSLMLLENWDYDKTNTEILNNYRISSNAVYPFKNNGKTFFLRYAPLKEKSYASLLAELDFMKFLQGRGYSVAAAVTAKNGKNCVLAGTPWGKYLAAVFERAPGAQLSVIPYSPALYTKYGEALAALHCLSSEYDCPGKRMRPDYVKILGWCQRVFEKYNAPAPAFEESALINRRLSALPKNRGYYGLIHYDFEPDNVFFDEKNGAVTPIDFDDCMYHWFAMDIEQAVDSIRNELPQAEEQAVRDFLNGYQRVKKLDDDTFHTLPLFRRFADLYAYARCLRASAEKWQNEPEWMTNLRGRLNDRAFKAGLAFGKDIAPGPVIEF